MSCGCDLFFIVISILIKINHIISLKRTRMFFLLILFSSSQNFSLRELLSIWLIFCQFKSAVAYKSVDYKKRVVLTFS